MAATPLISWLRPRHDRAGAHSVMSYPDPLASLMRAWCPARPCPPSSQNGHAPHIPVRPCSARPRDLFTNLLRRLQVTPASNCSRAAGKPDVNTSRASTPEELLYADNAPTARVDTSHWPTHLTGRSSRNQSPTCACQSPGGPSAAAPPPPIRQACHPGAPPPLPPRGPTR